MKNERTPPLKLEGFFINTIMKSFKQYLMEIKSDKEEPTPEDLNWGKVATGYQVGREFVDGTNLSADEAMLIGGAFSTPNNKARIRGEKAWNTDIGLAFDVDEDGEPVADQAGFKAVHQREKEGRSVPTAYPPITLQQTHNQLIDNLVQFGADLVNPETYKSLGKMVSDTFDSSAGPSTEEVRAKSEELKRQNYNKRFGQTLDPNI